MTIDLKRPIDLRWLFVRCYYSSLDDLVFVNSWKFYTNAIRDIRDKFHVWETPSFGVGLEYMIVIILRWVPNSYLNALLLRFQLWRES